MKIRSTLFFFLIFICVSSRAESFEERAGLCMGAFLAFSNDHVEEGKNPFDALSSAARANYVSEVNPFYEKKNIEGMMSLIGQKCGHLRQGEANPCIDRVVKDKKAASFLKAMYRGIAGIRGKDRLTASAGMNSSCLLVNPR